MVVPPCPRKYRRRGLPGAADREKAENSGRKRQEATMTGARLKHYGWGREGEGMTEAEQAFVLGRYRAKFSRDRFETIAVPRLEDLALRAPRITPPASLAAICTTDR